MWFVTGKTQILSPGLSYFFLLISRSFSEFKSSQQQFISVLAPKRARGKVPLWVSTQLQYPVPLVLHDTEGGKSIPCQKGKFRKITQITCRYTHSRFLTFGNWSPSKRKKKLCQHPGDKGRKMVYCAERRPGKNMLFSRKSHLYL